MENLSQIEPIRQCIKTASRKSMGVLYKLIFEEDGDRGNRSKLREFKGFKFRIDSDAFRNKMECAARFTV